MIGAPGDLVLSAMRAAGQLYGKVVKVFDRYVSIHLNTIYIFQDISIISALIPCARGIVSPAIPCFS